MALYSHTWVRQKGPQSNNGVIHPAGLPSIVVYDLAICMALLILDTSSKPF